MTIAEALRQSGLEPIDAEVLLADLFKKDRTWIVAHANDEIDHLIEESFIDRARRRREGEPVALITGKKDFFGRTFHVTRDTLIPRPATEEIVRTALNALAGIPVDVVREIDTQIVAWSVLKTDVNDAELIIDVGTGSGCIAITISCERPDLRIIATDISDDALKIAEENATNLKVRDRITFKKGSGLAAAEPIDRPFLLVSNPPYIPNEMKLDRDVADFEPHTALFGGKEGIDVLHPLIEEALKHPLCKGFVVECREEQVLKDLSPAQFGS